MENGIKLSFLNLCKVFNKNIEKPDGVKIIWGIDGTETVIQSDGTEIITTPNVEQKS